MTAGRTILRVDSSTAEMEKSATRQITQAVVDGLMALDPGACLDELDLARNPIGHLHGRPDPGNHHLAQFMAANVVVIGAPMYNFTVPTQLKAWIDQIVVAGHTFRYGPNGPEGLAGEKQVIVACAAGGMPGPDTNFVDPYLRLILGFMGIKDVRFIHAHGMSLDQQRAMALNQAIDEASQVAMAA